MVSFTPATDIPALTGKVIFITGGKPPHHQSQAGYTLDHCKFTN
jgi:hypothetical protein